MEKIIIILVAAFAVFVIWMITSAIKDADKLKEKQSRSKKKPTDRERIRRILPPGTIVPD
jgi:hypothetical protein